MGSFDIVQSLRSARFEPLQLDWTLRLRQPETILAREYWQSKCNDRSFPAREDLVPGEMRNFIANVGLIEARRDGDQIDYFIRHAGSKWEGVFGAMRERYLSEFLPPEIEMRWRTLFDGVRRAAKPVRARTRLGFQGKSWLLTEMFVAPLGDVGTVSMLFMCFTSWSDLPDFDA